MHLMSNESPLRIGIILSSTREGRFADRVADWVMQAAKERPELQMETIDLRDYPLPIFGEGDGEEVIVRWKERLAEFDGYVILTAEYQHSITGVLKNALDYVGDEMAKKPVAYVGYGGVGGARAVEHLRLVGAHLEFPSVKEAVHIAWDVYLAVSGGEKQLSDFDFLNESLNTTLDSLTWWGRTLRAGRNAYATASV